MRRIYTSILSVIFLMAFSAAGYAQTTCSISTTAPGGITFGTPLAVTTANNFVGTGTTTTGGNLTYPSNATSTITSPIYYFQSPQSTIHIRYTLDPANGSQVAIAPVITINYGAGGSQSFTCTTGAITPLQSSVTYFLEITPTTPFPGNTNFTVSVGLTTGSRDIEAINFTTNAILAGSGAVLPVKFGAFTARSTASGVQLNWTIDAEENTRGYEVERSAGGRPFTSIGSVTATGVRNYSFVDANPVASAQYRIKAIDHDGKVGYSITLNVKGNESSVDVKAFFSNRNSLTIQHDVAPAGSRVTITTADGKMLKSLPVNVGAQQTLIDVSAAVPGLMIVRFETSTGQVQTIKLVKQ